MYENVGVYSDQSLIAYWNFNSGTGDLVIDRSGNGHDGTIFGDPEWTDDIPPYMEAPEDDNNYSLHFWDQGNIDIGTEGFSSGDSPVTMEAWFYREYNGNDGREYLVGYGGDNGLGSMFAMGLNNNNFFVTFLGNDYDVVSSASYGLEQWHHVAAVHSGNGEVEIYLNGESIFTASVSVPNISSSNGAIGSSPLGGERWSGNIDEVRV
jgi:hypothetical protein